MSKKPIRPGRQEDKAGLDQSQVGASRKKQHIPIELQVQPPHEWHTPMLADLGNDEAFCASNKSKFSSKLDVTCASE